MGTNISTTSSSNNMCMLRKTHMINQDPGPHSYKELYNKQKQEYLTLVEQHKRLKVEQHSILNSIHIKLTIINKL